MATSESTFIKADLFLKDSFVFQILYILISKSRLLLLFCHYALGSPKNLWMTPFSGPDSGSLIANRSKYRDNIKQKLVKRFYVTFYSQF